MHCVFRFLIASQAMRPLRSVRCVACVAYDNLAAARRPMKTDLRSVSKLPYATHAAHATQIKKPQRTHTKNAMHAEHRIDCVRCVFLRACVVYFGFLIASQAMRPLRCMCCIRQLGNRT